MKDIPDIDSAIAREFERWLAGYPFDNRSKRLEAEREREAERKGEEERDERT